MQSETYTVQISDEHGTVRHSFSGLSHGLATREALDWIAIYKENAWRESSTDTFDMWQLFRGVGRDRQERCIQIFTDVAPSLREQFSSLFP